MISQKLIDLTRQLYPTGRAFKMPKDGDLEKLHVASNEVLGQAYMDSLSVLNSILPDNDNFTEEDAADWERRLGLITNTSVSLADRKLAIKRKMNHPGTIPARQHYLYLQGQLQAAGFDVYVHENLEGLDPIMVLPHVGFGDHGEFNHGEVDHGDALSVYSNLYQYISHGEANHGEANHGDYYFKNKIVNNLSALDDLLFNIGQNYKSSFFIGGEIKGTFANVDANRETEFRQLILKIKPVQTVGFLFINYI